MKQRKPVSKNSGDTNGDYPSLLVEVKERIRAAQYEALKAVNMELVGLYWDIGRLIVTRQQDAKHGASIAVQLALDLRSEFPGIKGFSRRNVFYMREFYLRYHEDPKVQPLAAQIAWSHNLAILQRCEDAQEREFYLRMTRKFGWSKNVLIHQIENQTYEKSLLGQTNFDRALTPELRAQAKLAVKDEYTFDFLDLAEEHSERTLERALISRIEDFLRAMGGLFTFVGSQFRLDVDGNEYVIDLLLFHRRLKALVALDLKIGKFQPEYVGKMQFYLAALDRLIREESENPSIGIILCKEKNRTVVEYALHDARKPIGVATYEIRKTLPKALKGQLPVARGNFEVAGGLVRVFLKRTSQREASGRHAGAGTAHRLSQNWSVESMMKHLWVLTVLIVATLCRAEEPKPFYIGVYLYDYQMAAAAESVGKEYFAFLEEHLKILQDHGVNVIHLAVSKPEQFGEHLRLAEKYGIKLLPQLDFVYFNPAESDEAQEARAQQAGAFLREHAKDPRVLAWSVKEEVFHADVNRLAKYYFQILQHAPDTKFFTLNNALGAAKDQPVPDPIISGTDRYAFWWEFSGGGYLASPAFALDWTRSEAAVYYEESARRGADFMLVTTASGLLMPQWANTLANTPHEVAYPTTPDEQLAMQKKALAFAEEGRMGWRKFATPAGDFYDVWKYYRAPKNCVKAMAWTGVLEGAKLFLLWHYEPIGNSDRLLNAEQAARSGLWEIQYVTLAGRPGMDNPQLAEFAEASREIRAYESIITQMAKVPDCPVQTDDKNVHANAFTFPGLKGRIIVMQNANIGTWPADSRTMFKDDDPIRIDDDGNLVGCVPFTEPTEVRFSLTEKGTGDGVYDLKTGAEVLGEGGYKISIAPGSGVLLYLGSAEDAGMLSGLVR